MPTQNEEQLKIAVDNLQSKMQEVTAYIKVLQETFNQMFVANDSSTTQHGEMFHQTQSFYMNLPFYANPGESSVSVYVLEGNGKFRAVTPIITYMGNSIQFDFDSPQSG